MLRVIAKIKDHRSDFGVLALLGLAVVFFFGKVVFMAKPISKVFLLGKRDVLFHKYLTLGPSGFDESVYLLLAPYYRLVAHYWRHFQLPLWNPYCGWGLPLLGDIQSAAFSPFRILFALNPSMYQFNLLIVFEVLVAVTGTYVLARHLRVGRILSVMAACNYGFCPYFLYFIELLSGTTSALLPWLFWLFARLAAGPTLKRAVACAVGCAVFIASGHPEASFIGVSFATLCMMLIFAFKKQLPDGLRWTGAIAVIAVCLAAPVILPFLEYLHWSDCYKFRNAATELVACQGLLLNLLQPMYFGASPYLGFLAPAFMLLAFFENGGKRLYILSFSITSLVAFICLCRPLFFAALFDMTPAGLVPGIYCAPVFLLCLAVLSAFGGSYFVDQLKMSKNKDFMVFLGGLLVTCFLPAILNIFGFPFQSGNFDKGVADMAFNAKNWIVTMGLSFVVCFLLHLKNKNKLPATVLSICIVAMSFGSQALANKQSLPNQPSFNYDQFAPLPFLQQQGKRILALGFDVLCPNTNIVYQIASVGSHNVMAPDRYIKYMVAAGANWTTFNTVFDRVPLSNMIDYSGVKYVVSLAPVYGQREKAASLVKVPFAHDIGFAGAAMLKLKEAAVFYDRRKAEVVGHLKFDLPESDIKRFSYSIVVMDAKGNPLWFGGLSPMRSAARKNWPLSPEEMAGYAPLSALVPVSLRPGQEFYLGVQVFDGKLSKFLDPILDANAKGFGSVFCLSKSVFANPDTAASDLHYRFVSESGPEKIRVYENTKSLGRAYLVFSSQRAASPDEALKKLSSKHFDGFSKVILEGVSADAGASAENASEKENAPGIAVPIKFDSANRLEMDVNCPKDGYLVLTDTFFPGWKAMVDGKSVEILRANYLFRAVAIPAGRHTVVFTYQPLSFTIAVWLFFAGIVASGFLLWKERRS